MNTILNATYQYGLCDILVATCKAVSGRMHLAATNTGRMEAFSFVAPLAWALEYLMFWTDKTKIVERFTLSKGGKELQDQLTITDPTVLTGPWVVTLRYARMPADSERLEAVCEPDLDALKATDLVALKGLDPDAARLLDPARSYNPGSR